MNAKDALKLGIDMGKMISMGYLEDLTDQEFFHRPAKGANHINWQLGHLIASEVYLVSKAGGKATELPAGFAEMYSKDAIFHDEDAAYQQALTDAQPKQRDKLRAAQRLWIQFRDTNCMYYRLGEGTIAAIEAGYCMMDTTKTRALELEQKTEKH